MSSLIGYNPEQVPTNQMLGKLAFMDDIPFQKTLITVDNLAALRALSGAKGDRVYVLGNTTPGDGGNGVFIQSATAVTDDNGIYILAADGTSWTRVYDGFNVSAAWWGLTTSTTDCGPYFANFPTNVYVWFGPGAYTFLTYPTQAQFKDRFYRGVNTIWRCNGSLAGTLSTGDLIPAFTWSFDQAYQASDNNGGNIGDMMLAGLSPIEGIGIIGNSQTQGVGFAFGNTGTNIYFMRPKNFSVQNFGVGFMYLRSMHNCFLTGLENVTLKSNGTNLICDNTNLENPSAPGAYNSGENYYFKSCYIGGATVVGVNVVHNQLCTFDNCSFDYNVKMGIFNNSNVKMTNCYVEGNPSGTPAQNWFDVLGVSCLDVDSSTNIYMLGGTLTQMNSWDVFNVNSNGFGSPNVRCNASFFSSPVRYKPLMSSNALSVYGTLMRCNSAATAPPLSEANNLIPDARFSQSNLNYYPGSTNCTLGSSSQQPYSGATSALQMLPTTSAPSVFSMPSFAVVPAKDINVQFLYLVSGTVGALNIGLTFYTLDGVLIGRSTFISGNYTTSLTLTTGAWTGYRNAYMVPMGAAKCVVTLTLPATSDGTSSIQIGTTYVYQ